MMSTVLDVPSPVMSSCATAVRAIITAVGFWICISFSRTLPSCRGEGGGLSLIHI